MANLFARLSKIDQISKETVQGWVRMHQKKMNQIQIPSMILSLITLYINPDEIFDPKCTNKIKLSHNNKCILQQEEKRIRHPGISPREESIYETGYGVNLITLNCKWIYQWDVQINKHYNWDDGLAFIPIFIALESDNVRKKYFHSLVCKAQFKYSSEGAILTDKEWKKYGQIYKEKDLISIILDLNKMTISFRLNGKDQGIAYSNIKDELYGDTKLRLAVTINIATTSVEIVNFFRHK